MGIFDKLRGELIDIIQWLDDSNDTMVCRFERYNNEIKYGAKLVVREGQSAVFENEGRIADVFGPGTYTLETQNMPVLATLKGWKYGFESPFKVEVYFCSMRAFTDLKWGTKNPLMLRDQEFGPVRLRAFGTYVVRIADPAAFIRTIVGTDGLFTTGEVADQLRNMIVARFSNILGGANIPILDLAGNYDQLGKFLSDRISPEFAQYGLELSQFLVENISLPPEVEAALDKRTSMGVIGDLNKYTQFQTAEALRDAAKNPGGAAGAGVGLGLGVGMAQQMAAQMTGAANIAPPLPGSTVQFHVALDGKQAGPFDQNVLRQMAGDGRLTRETLVWRGGMANWTPAGQVAEIAGLFSPTPPPLPK